MPMSMLAFKIIGKLVRTLTYRTKVRVRKAWFFKNIMIINGKIWSGILKGARKSRRQPIIRNWVRAEKLFLTNRLGAWEAQRDIR